MPIDFKKLNDPAFQDEMRREREARAQQAEEHEKKLRGWIDSALDHYDQLSEREREFVRSCRHRLNTFQHLTEPQEKWLGDIANRCTSERMPEAQATLSSGFAALRQFAAAPISEKRSENDIAKNTAARAIPDQKSGEPGGAVFAWAQFVGGGDEGYEVSSAGDSRFSALYARLSDGRTIEEAYQLDVKGYRALGNDWRLGKGKPPRQPMTHEEIWQAYKQLWRQWALENPQLIAHLRQAAAGKVLTDRHAATQVSQARALAEILSESPEFCSTPVGESTRTLQDADESPASIVKNLPVDLVGAVAQRTVCEFVSNWEDWGAAIRDGAGEELLAELEHALATLAGFQRRLSEHLMTQRAVESDDAGVGDESLEPVAPRG